MRARQPLWENVLEAANVLAIICVVALLIYGAFFGGINLAAGAISSFIKAILGLP